MTLLQITVIGFSTAAGPETVGCGMMKIGIEKELYADPC
jgi:hypothetical protein